MNHSRFSLPSSEALPDETLDFLNKLYAKNSLIDVCLTLTAIHPTKSRPAPSRHIPFDDRSTLHSALQQIHAANAQGWGAYFAVAVRRRALGRWQRGDANSLIALPALFVDVDQHSADTLMLLRRFPLPPSCIVDSGGGGYHAYWWLEIPTVDFHRAKALLQALAGTLGGDSLSIAQSMRLPGTINTKPERGGLCHIIDCPDYRYALADFDKVFSKLSTSQSQKPFTTVQTVHTLHSGSQQCQSGRLNPELVQLVIDRLVKGYDGSMKPNGYVAALCPCQHQRDRAGMHFNFDPLRGVGRCFGKHGRLLLKDLCDLLMIDPSHHGGIYRDFP